MTNNTGASITGNQYGIFAIGFANVTNSGSITSTGSGGIRAGIIAATDATVTNNAGASITSNEYGILANTGFANVTNSGSITGTATYGIAAGTNATVINNAAPASRAAVREFTPVPALPMSPIPAASPAPPASAFPPAPTRR